MGKKKKKKYLLRLRELYPEGTTSSADNHSADYIPEPGQQFFKKSAYWIRVLRVLTVEPMILGARVVKGVFNVLLWFERNEPRPEDDPDD